MFYNDRPRNWKWMVPAALVGPCLVWWSAWSEGDVRESGWAAVPMILTITLGLAALMNLLLYFLQARAEMSANLRAVQNSTPEVRMFEAAKGMHPEAVKALVAHRRTLWRIRYVPQADLADWVLDEARNVHAGFVEFVLDNSSNVALMPKRLLSDGSRQFDPEGQATDYEQYDSLVLLMQQKLMVTQAFGNQAPQWIPPYTRELARHRFGLDGGADAADGTEVQKVADAPKATEGAEVPRAPRVQEAPVLTESEAEAVRLVEAEAETRKMEVWRKLQKAEVKGRR